MNLIAPPFTFGFDVLSYSIGTAYPRSIVVAGDDTYFISNGKVMVIRQGQFLEPVGRGKVTRYLFDAEFETEAIDQQQSFLRSDIDSTIIGAYDSYSNLIWWIYRVVGGDFYQSDFFLIYSIDEDRFTHGQLISPENRDMFEHVLSNLNTVNSGTAMTKGITLFSFDQSGGSTTEHAAWSLSSNTTLPIVLKSKILSANYIARASEREIHNIVINQVRLLYRTSTGSALSVPVTITLVASENENFPVGGTTTRIASSNNSNDDGWYPVDETIQGGFFTWQADIPAITGNSLREITGLEVDWEVAGEF